MTFKLSFLLLGEDDVDDDHQDGEHQGPDHASNHPALQATRPRHALRRQREGGLSLRAGVVVRECRRWEGVVHQPGIGFIKQKC